MSTGNLAAWPLVVVLLSAASASAAEPARRGAPRVLDAASRAEATATFGARVAQYLDLQNRERKQLPALPEKATPEQIAAYETQLAARMRAVRKGARQGELIPPPVEALFRQVFDEELKGRDDAAARKSVAEGNPRLEAEGDARPVQVAVNGTYTDAPLATTPPSLLLKLPPLPEQLAYRFVGRHLTIRDNESGLVVDYLLNAAPPLPAAGARNK